MDTTPLTVAIVARRLAGNVVFLDLAATTGRLPAFTAGAHIDVHLPSGLIRQYSLWNPPQDEGLYRIAVRLDRQGRGGSAAVHGLAEGAVLTIGTPRNAFPLEAEGPVVLVGAGIGVTPLFSMAAALHAAARPFVLHYVERGSRAAFRDMALHAPWAASFRFHDTASGRPDPTRLLDGCRPGGWVYLCGPAGFMADIRRAAAALPIAPLAIREECFTPRPVEAGEAFAVQTARDGRWHRVAADRSIVEVLRAAGYEIPTSCEQGICGACSTRVLGGRPLHQDMVLTDAEHASGSVMTPCCSRSLGPELILDL